MKLQVQTRIQAPIEMVAALLTSAEDAPLWQQDLARMEVVRGGPNEIGSVARLHYVEHGRAYVMHDELLDCDEGRRWKSQVSGNGMTVEVETELEDSDGDTILRMSWNGRPEAWWARLLFPLLRSTVRRRMTADLSSLNRVVRARAAGETA